VRRCRRARLRSHFAIDALGVAAAAAAMSDHEDEPATLHDGYHGWMKSIPKTQRDFTPVRIESAASVEAAPSAQGNSAWNAAGTWCVLQSRVSESTAGRTHPFAHTMSGRSATSQSGHVNASSSSSSSHLPSRTARASLRSRPTRSCTATATPRCVVHHYGLDHYLIADYWTPLSTCRSCSAAARSAAATTCRSSSSGRPSGWRGTPTASMTCRGTSRCTTSTT
jgi:hypothetical protein